MVKRNEVLVRPDAGFNCLIVDDPELYVHCAEKREPGAHMHERFMQQGADGTKKDTAALSPSPMIMKNTVLSTSSSCRRRMTSETVRVYMSRSPCMPHHPC